MLLPSALLGAAAGVSLRNHGIEPRTLSLLFGAFLCYVAAQLLWRRPPVSPDGASPPDRRSARRS